MSATRPMRGSVAICIGALLFLAVISLLTISRTGITTDEVIHIPAGYYALESAEFRMNAEHPPLTKMWAALPLLILAAPDDGPSEAHGNFSQRGAIFYNHFWEVNRDHFEEIWFWSRAMMLAFTLGLGTLLFMASDRWFGRATAVFAVCLFCLEPTILGHGHLVHTDIPAAFMYLLFFFVLDLYRQEPTHARAAALALVTALALTTKFSMLVLMPILLACFAGRAWQNRRNVNCRQRNLLHAAMAVVIIFLTIHAVYRFRNEPVGPDDTAWLEGYARSPGLLLKTTEMLSPILPGDFLFGAAVVAAHNSVGHSSSILGLYDYRGWWYYFPVAFALKVPLPFLFLSLVGLVSSLWLLRKGSRTGLFVLLPLALYCIPAMSSRINIGIRHLLPAYPFLFMIAGMVLAALYKRMPRTGLLVAGVVLGWMGTEAVLNFPYYIPYMNQLKGDRPGWQYLSDSNVEWGEGVPALASFLRERNVKRVGVALLGGRMTLPFYGIEIVDLFSSPPVPETRYVAIGASFLNGSTVDYGVIRGEGTEEDRIGFFDAYRRRTPLTILGNSIYVFDNEATSRSDNPDRAP